MLRGMNMEILNRSIRIIDYENHRISSRETPATFDEYVVGLINHISTNDSTREYKTRTVVTEVIGSILQIMDNKENAELVLARIDGIANRLLDKEIEAQRKVARMNTNVLKGSLIQAVLYNEEEETYTYLLAKVEHSDFVDDSDFSFKTGFSTDKKTVWKSCLFDLPDSQAQEYHARVYTNTVANYWSEDFLELEQMLSNEVNTEKAFRSIEATLNQNMRKEFPRDHTIIRNAFIAYFKGNEHIDYPTMVNSVLEHYEPVDLPIEKVDNIRNKMLLLPESKKFDHQFESVKSAINARIKKVYPVNDGIELKITDSIDDIENTISAYRDHDGVRYIKIKTNNDETYQRFKSQN